MAIATWWQGDSLPQIAVDQEFEAVRCQDASLMAKLNRIPLAEVERRIAEGHVPYIALWSQQPVGYGWVAQQQFSIGELNLECRLAAGDRYLWDFGTLAQWRGRGFYPRLLQAILQSEQPHAQRFWIIHAPENVPSSRGILRSGFQDVAELAYDHQQQVRLAPRQDLERAQAAAELLGLSLVAQDLSDCWHCHPHDQADCGPVGVAECTCAMALVNG
jgi:GNAT superfamily N-acetyltransferase